MLRPEQMSRVSVTGAKAVQADVIEAIHDANLVHLIDYDGGWSGFENGDPLAGNERTTQQLVTVRSLISILDVDRDAHEGPKRVIDADDLAEELETLRTEVTELDDRRSELRDERRAVDDRLDAIEPFRDLGIDLDLLGGYGDLEVAVGEGSADAVRDAVGDQAAVEDVEVFTADDSDVIAVVAYVPDGPEGALDDALVGVDFTALEIPDREAIDDILEGGVDDADPDRYVAGLEKRRKQLDSKLETVENELEDVRVDAAGFLLSAEEQLAIQVQKAEAPLQFATTERAFLAEGWIPTDEVVRLREVLDSAVGERVEVEEIEVADYESHGHADHADEDHGGTEESTRADGDAVAADGGSTADAATDGGSREYAPPVRQKNSAPVKPFEALVEVINRPKYDEFDPTLAFFLTFPAFFGFMIGDLGYGILYVGIGYWLFKGFDSDVVRSLGGVAMWAGGFTMLFGILYGEIFGLHQLGEIVWGGDPPIHKGLQPYHADYALGWLVLSLIAGMIHLAVGWTFDFVKNLEHGIVDAVTESGSWLLMMFGLWTWIFADAPPTGSAPGLLVGSESVFNGHPFPLGFAGFSDPVGFVGLGAFVVGLGLLGYADKIELVESLNVLVNVLSYTRLAAVLLAKAGMAFVVNLLFFGVYVTEDHGAEVWHFGTGHMPQVGETYHGHEVTNVMFGGLSHGPIAAVAVGILVLVVGHLLVLALGITSAGLQAVRLEYVEFFGKFYEGGGEKYNPFGYERRYTTED